MEEREKGKKISLMILGGIVLCILVVLVLYRRNWERRGIPEEEPSYLKVDLEHLDEDFEKRVFWETPKTRELFPELETDQDYLTAALIRDTSQEDGEEVFLEAYIEVYYDETSDPAGGLIVVKNSLDRIIYTEQAACVEECRKSIYLGRTEAYGDFLLRVIQKDGYFDYELFRLELRGEVDRFIRVHGMSEDCDRDSKNEFQSYIDHSILLLSTRDGSLQLEEEEYLYQN